MFMRRRKKEFYCEYCDVFLKPSLRARREHMSGKPHMANYEAYYNSLPAKAPALVQEIKERVAASYEEKRQKELKAIQQQKRECDPAALNVNGSSSAAASGLLVAPGVRIGGTCAPPVSPVGFVTVGVKARSPHLPQPQPFVGGPPRCAQAPTVRVGVFAQLPP